MKKKNQEMLVVSKFFEEANDFEKRYKSLKKTIKSIKKFKEVQFKGKIAEA
ncbi:MAG TPA: hypothetical protein PLU63_00325 [Candidatus Woesebacteria bacterium]|nr:hypothetical protein [Candidatus Woesebacteria bacterium]